jgi:hypothetical protein
MKGRELRFHAVFYSPHSQDNLSQFVGPRKADHLDLRRAVEAGEACSPEFGKNPVAVFDGGCRRERGHQQAGLAFDLTLGFPQ